MLRSRSRYNISGLNDSNTLEDDASAELTRDSDSNSTRRSVLWFWISFCRNTLNIRQTLCHRIHRVSVVVVVTTMALLLLLSTYTGRLDMPNLPLWIGNVNANSSTTSEVSNGLRLGKERARAFLSDRPVVNRSILRELDRLQDLSDPDPDEARYLFYAIRTRASGDGQWPPMVTAIPESRSHKDLQRDAVSPDQDQHHYSVSHIQPSSDSYAPSSNSRRFILPMRLAEQESKAQQHLLQILHLARSLNRTLVLPNVGKSRMGVCMKWGFGTYYDVRSFKELVESGFVDPDLGGNGAVVTMDEFKMWMANRRRMTAGQIVYVGAKGRGQDLYGSEDAMIVHFDGLDLRIHLNDDGVHKRASCLRNRFKRLLTSGPFPPLSIHLREDSRANQDLGLDGLIKQALSDNDLVAKEASFHSDSQTHATDQPDVLLVDWDLRHPVFSLLNSGISHLNYSVALSSLANNISSTLGPYLAIHWRLETVPLESLHRCALALVDTLVDILANQNTHSALTGLQTVWIATDFPLTMSGAGIETKRRSGTFKTISPEHVEAIDVLRNAFEEGGQLSGWELVDLDEGLRRLEVQKQDVVERVREVLDDEGVLGIVDKMVAMNAEMFVSGAKGCAKTSSFTKQIVDSRRLWSQNEDVTLRNVVVYFGAD